MTEHKWYKCPPGCTDPHCVYCVGGLGTCTVCGASEGELTTDCPGREMTQEEKNKVYHHNLDYLDGEWIERGDGQYN